MAASFDLLLRAGVDAVWRHVDGLLDHLAGGLAGLGAEVLSDRTTAGRSAILSFRMPGLRTAELCEALDARGIVCAPRVGGIRVAPHGYTSVDDIDALVAAVAELADPGGGERGSG
jgi:selenocysteine lyase/cysteine desulfurase